MREPQKQSSYIKISKITAQILSGINQALSTDISLTSTESWGSKLTSKKHLPESPS